MGEYMGKQQPFPLVLANLNRQDDQGNEFFRRETQQDAYSLPEMRSPKSAHPEAHLCQLRSMAALYPTLAPFSREMERISKMIMGADLSGVNSILPLRCESTNGARRLRDARLRALVV